MTTQFFDCVMFSDKALFEEEFVRASTETSAEAVLAAVPAIYRRRVREAKKDLAERNKCEQSRLVSHAAKVTSAQEKCGPYGFRLEVTLVLTP